MALIIAKRFQRVGLIPSRRPANRRDSHVAADLAARALAVGLIIDVVTIDYGLQSVHVANPSLIYRVRPEAQSRLSAGYMVCYSIGSASGSISSTLVYAAAGWNGFCLVGAAISAIALAFWALTRHLTPEVPA